MTEPTASNEASAGGVPAPSDVASASGSPGVCGGGVMGTDCEEALRDLYSYLDGEITEERREHIRHHIDECGPCLEAFDFEVELRQLVARTCQRDAPDSLRDRIARAIHDFDDAAGDGAPG